MDNLYRHAMELGVKVEFTDLSQLRRNGDYCHELRLIRIQEGMQPRKTRHTFGHELAHATFGDEPTILEHLHQKQERRADEWAAHFLIDPEEFSESEQRYGGHVPSMAVDLYVLEKTVHAYKRTLHRIGDEIFVSPRMGAGNWDAKIKVA